MAVLFHGIGVGHWCPYAILITNNTTLVEFTKPREHIYADLVIHIQQIDHHPVLADQAVPTRQKSRLRMVISLPSGGMPSQPSWLMVWIMFGQPVTAA